MNLQVITWSKANLLNWSDFMAEPNPAVFEDAKSTIQYRISWTVNSEKIGEQILFFIKDIQLSVEFYPMLSWVREMYATPELLKHEQGHFDLAELLRNCITKQITDTFSEQMYPVKGKNEEQRKQFAKEQSALLLEVELKKWQSYLDEQQHEYDNKTNFGQDVKAQSLFDEQFSQLRK